MYSPVMLSLSLASSCQFPQFLIVVDDVTLCEDHPCECSYPPSHRCARLHRRSSVYSPVMLSLSRLVHDVGVFYWGGVPSTTFSCIVSDLKTFSISLSTTNDDFRKRTYATWQLHRRSSVYPPVMLLSSLSLSPRSQCKDILLGRSP